MKRKIIAIFITLIMAIAACFALAACTTNGKEAENYVSIDINPSIELTLDRNDKVLSVRGANEDGQVLLYGEADLKGLKVEAAVEKITELAVEYGYVNEDNKVAQINVVGNARAEAIASKINAKVEATAQRLNVQISCAGADAYSLARQLENLKAKYPDGQAIQSLTPSKLKLVVSASETGEISIEAAAEMDTSKLVETVSDVHAKAEQYATDAYVKAKAVAENAYEKVQAAAIDAIYTTYFAANFPISAYYPTTYYVYKMSAVATNALADVIFYADKACDTPLNEEQIAAVARALGLGEDLSAIKNSKGEITVRSIEAYADKLFKNSQANAELQQIKSALTSALNSAESAIQAEIDRFNDEYKTELEQIKTALVKSVNDLQILIAGLLPEESKQQIASMVKDINDIADKVAAVLDDGKVTSDEVRSLAKEMSDKAAASKKVMESKLSEEDLDRIAELQAAAEQKLASAKAQMDEAIAKAETEAKAYLQRLKDARASK